MTDSEQSEEILLDEPQPPTMEIESAESVGSMLLTAAEPQAPVEPTKLAKLQGLPWAIAANSLNTFYAQFTFFGSAFVLFLDSLGMDKAQIGLLLSLLPFANIIAPLAGPYVARFGYKRAFLTAFGARKIVTLFLLLTPWVAMTYGEQATVVYVAAIVGVFAILRALVETAHLPWVQEYVPNSMRGKFSATDNLFVTLSGMTAVLVAGAVIGRTTGLSGYMVLMGTGVLLGFLSLWAYTFVPGGAATPAKQSSSQRSESFRFALQDRDYRRYLLGVGLVTLGTVPLATFLPLYLQEQAGIEPGQVIWVQIGSLAGALASGYLWGWAADRYGSKPVMLFGTLWLILTPFFWWFLPMLGGVTLALALGAAFAQGVANLGWAIGAGRLLFANIVPPLHKVGYMAIYSACIGIIAGVSQVSSGYLLDIFQGIDVLSGTGLLNPYTPLILLAVTLPMVSFLALRGIQPGLGVGTLEFAGIFLRGNPFVAMSSLVKFNLAKDERSTVLRTEQMGQARSRLTVEELLSALHDPRFSVRYEAIIAISRTRPDPRLTEALVHLLTGTELALSTNAAWALGRTNDASALPALRDAAVSSYRSIQVHAIRALGTLNDVESAQLLLERLQSESDAGVRMASASSLGRLRVHEAIGPILEMANHMENAGARLELALALARMIGDETRFIRLARRMQGDPGTVAAQALTSMRAGLGLRRKGGDAGDAIQIAYSGCISAFSQDDLDLGARHLSELIRALPSQRFSADVEQVLFACADSLESEGFNRTEMAILAIYALDLGLRDARE